MAVSFDISNTQLELRLFSAFCTFVDSHIVSLLTATAAIFPTLKMFKPTSNTVISGGTFTTHNGSVHIDNTFFYQDSEHTEGQVTINNSSLQTVNYLDPSGEPD